MASRTGARWSVLRVCPRSARAKTVELETLTQNQGFRAVKESRRTWTKRGDGCSGSSRPRRLEWDDSQTRASVGPLRLGREIEEHPLLARRQAGELPSRCPEYAGRR